MVEGSNGCMGASPIKTQIMQPIIRMPDTHVCLARNKPGKGLGISNKVMVEVVYRSFGAIQAHPAGVESQLPGWILIPAITHNSSTLSNDVDIPVMKRLMQMIQISRMGYQTTTPQQGE
ncbi:lysine aminopeptidase ApsA [Aspergillus luchuensis]|uniref:Lysine aminopeptidase ApsA n=1 Tax=Aspergillus kawachii TaxID=1069201 RepID=A0A146FXD7_ASPKA|nr:lysine aminopeptidase ApsA [Aspergillus luchuensis]